MDHITSEEFDNEIIRMFKEDIPLGGYITSRDVARKNTKITAMLFKANIPGVHYGSPKEETFLSYRIKSAINKAEAAGKLDSFAVVSELVGPVFITKVKKRKIKAWVKKERGARNE